MEAFKLLDEKLNEVKAGKVLSSEFYSGMLGKMVHLTPAQRNQLFEKAENLNETDIESVANMALVKGMRWVFEADFVKALESLHFSKSQFDLLDMPGGKMSAENLLSVAYRSIGQLEKAQIHMGNALKALEKVEKGNTYWYFLPITFYQAGELNVYTKNYEAAKEYYEKGMLYAEDNIELQGRLVSGIGGLLMVTEDWKNAIGYFNVALEMSEKSGNHLLHSKLLSDIGNYHLKNKDHKLALEFQNKSLDLRLEKGHVNPAITNYIQLAEIHVELGELDEAIRLGNLAIEQSTKLNTIIKLFEAHHVLSKVYEKVGDYQKAFDHYKKYQKYKDEVQSQETIKKIEQISTQHKVEIMQQEKEIFRLRNVELKEAFEEIHDSFRYARRIQMSLLPTEKYIEKVMRRLRGNSL